MASASGPPKDSEPEPVHGRGQREPHESTSSSAAAATSADDSVAAAAEGGAVASHTQGRAPPPREQPGGGGGGRGTVGSTPDAAAVDRKGKKPVDEGSSRAPYDFSEQAVKNAKIADYPTRAPRSKERRRKEKKKSDSLIKKLLRSSILAFKGDKKKVSDRKGKQLDEASTPKSPPHVHHKKIPIQEAPHRYFGDVHNVLRQRESQQFVFLRLLDLDSKYSELRQVCRDGESFYRSFIFSYLEQIVDRVDTHEEDRLLAAVRELACRAEQFQWASEFSRRRKAFETLIEKIKGWKRRSEHPTSTLSYNRGEFLLEFFSGYDTTDDIFAFLRLAAASWMCSPDHRAMYAPGVTGLGEGRSLEDWCLTQVIPPRVHADRVAMNALAAALQVAVRVETPDCGGHQDIYYIARDTPRVTVVCVADSHYDIIYPLSPDSIHQRPKREELGASWLHCCIGGDLNLLRPARQQRGQSQHPDPASGTSSRGAGQREGDRAESSSQGAARARARWLPSCIGDTKKQQS